MSQTNAGQTSSDSEFALISTITRAHKQKMILKLLRRTRDSILNLTPVDATWVNMAEWFFEELPQAVIQHSSLHGVQQLYGGESSGFQWANTMQKAIFHVN